MVTTVERQRLRKELVSQGYRWDYVDSWPPKTTLYRHAPGLDVEGNEVSPVGTAIKGVPGNPDYVARKSRLGMLPFPPNEGCECRWCVEKRGPVAEVPAGPPQESVGVVEEAVESLLSVVQCGECGFKATGATTSGAISRLRVHSKTHQVSSAVGL